MALSTSIFVRPQEEGSLFDHASDDIMFLQARVLILLSSSMAEHPAVNRRVVGSSPT